VRGRETARQARATLETKKSGQRLQARRGPELPSKGGSQTAETLLGAQATEISRQFRPWQIRPVCADFLVELRGFEPMAIAGAQ
jgi:hypothetical protein